MSETVRTGVFIAAGILALIIAFFVRPATPEREAFDDSGERFFAEFLPTDARDLKIATFEETTGIADTFQVSSADQAWVIPSHEDYPADAEEHLASAAASVVDLVKGPKVSDQAADHGLYGVVDPEAPGAASVGVGTRVTMRDASGALLADLIVGATVKDSPGIRYVRIPDRDRVYTAKIDPTYLTTRFQDWIEEDLLQLETADIRRIVINDYTIDEVNQRIVSGDLVELGRADADAEWFTTGLSESETLDTEVLSALTTALDDLEIIDVHRKPGGLSRELQADDSLQLDREAISSLTSRGFYIAGGALVSNQGETVVHLDSGVIYVLRFGEIALGDREGGTLDDTETPAEDEGAARYLFVMAEFDAGLIPPPEFDSVPEVPDAPETETPAADDADDGAVSAERQHALLVAARDRIIQTNERLQKEYDDAIEAGQQRMAELNERFADWYYVIANDEYQKVRLSRGEIVVPVEAEGAPGDAG